MSNSTPPQATQSKSARPKRHTSRPAPASTARASAVTSRPTFSIACWLLALLAFAQLITVGTALAVKQQKPIIVQQTAAPAPPVVSTPLGDVKPRSLEEILRSVGDGPSTELAGSPLSGTPAAPAQAPLIAPIAPKNQMPLIRSPRVERLVKESRKHHLEGDMMRAMLKLHEAEAIDAKEPAIIYQKGLLLEEMGNLPAAADEYQKLQQMGAKIGVYFQLSARKLRLGMDTAKARRNAIAIGPMKTAKGQGAEAKTHADVSITLLARPDKDVLSKDVEVQVHFYDRLDGKEIKKALPSAAINTRWVTLPIDWKAAGNEETLQVSYTIPAGNYADEHLLGKREFYGYVCELIYKGEVVDQQAWPRRLNNIHGGGRLQPDLGVPDPWLPDGIDDGGILPHKNGGLVDPANLPLPTK
ncbi:MAG: tetratricopeptide repeat protein [Akkermansiaceae bacterium]